MNKLDEQILVAPRPVLFGLTDRAAFQGVRTDPEWIDSVLHAFAIHGHLRRRGDVEQDPDFKQLIPYCVLARKSRRGLELFAYERLSGRGERRLHGRISLGVGGHMNVVPSRDDPATAVICEAMREIHEEVVIHGETDGRLAPIGIINDDRDDVGRVHLGILLELRLDGDARVRVRETTQLAGSWVPAATLATPSWRSRLEGWAELALDAFMRREEAGARAVPASA